MCNKIFSFCIFPILIFISSISHGQEIRMSGSDWPVFEFAKGMVARNMIPNFKYTFTKYKSCLKQLEHSKIDVTFLTLYDFVILARSLPGKFTAIAVIDYSSGGDAMVVRPDIKLVGQLKGKSVGLDLASISFYLLHLILAENNVQISDMKLKNITGEFIDDAFLNNSELAGVIGWNPNIADILSKTSANKIYDSSDFPRRIYDLIVVRKESLQTNRDKYLDLLKKWYPATTDQEVISAVAKSYKVPVQEYKSWLEDAYIYHKASDAKARLSDLKFKAGSIASFLNNPPAGVPPNLEKTFGSKSVDIDSLFDFTLLAEIDK